jgi:hypothetical protein
MPYYLALPAHRLRPCCVLFTPDQLPKRNPDFTALLEMDLSVITSLLSDPGDEAFDQRHSILIAAEPDWQNSKV